MEPLAASSNVPLPPRPRFVLATVSTVIAVASIVINAQFEAVSKHTGLTQYPAVWRVGTSAVFLIFGTIAVRSAATQLARVVHVGAGPSAAAAIRLILTFSGLVVVVIVTIGMLGVDPTKLIAAAGVTGVIFGLAAQQSLGNVFAGIVLMLARPFTVGQRIRVRASAFGGIFDGEVREMGLTYVQLMTDVDGLVHIPNLGMLAAAVGEAPARAESPTSA